MPTINQLVKKPRTKKLFKSKAPAMQFRINTLKRNKRVDVPAPFKR